MDQYTYNEDRPPLDTSLFFQQMLENSQLAGIIVFDRTGKILETSLGIKKTFGYSRGDLIGKNFNLLFTPEDRLKNLPQIELANATSKGTSADNNYLMHKNGSRIWVHGESVLTTDTEGKLFIIKIIFDMSQQKLLENFLVDSNRKLRQVEQSLKRKVEELDRINKDLDTFVYAASHDLKSPLNNIEALFTALYEDLSEESRENIKELQEMILSSLQKFKNTLNDLAMIGKLQADAPDEVYTITFDEVMEDVLSNLQEMIKSSGAHLHSDFSRAPRIRFSRKNLRSVLTNLISNAVKYRSPEREPDVQVSTEKTDGFIILKVRDNGLGIREADKSRIFSIYQRLNEEVEGTGVGLTIVKRIADLNGGKVEIESEVGKGSTFKVYLKESVLTE